VNRFWGRPPDGVSINEALQIVCILDFQQSTTRDEVFLEVKEAEAILPPAGHSGQRGTRPTTEGSRENIGHNVHV